MEIISKIKQNKTAFSFLFILIIVIISSALLKHDSLIKTGTYAQFRNNKITLTVADTESSRERGLSGQLSLGKEQGMLFEFDKPSNNYFWMKDMHFPIDIIWLDENMHVIYIKKNADPKSYPETYGPDVDSKWVIETVAGFTDSNNVNIGDFVEVYNTLH